MRNQELFKNYVKAMEKQNEAELDCRIAKMECQKAWDAYEAAEAADKARKQEIIDTLNGIDEAKDSLMYVLDNQEEILDLFFSDYEKLNYESRKLDREIAKHGEEQPKEPFKGAITEMKEMEAAAAAEIEEKEEDGDVA